jgi:hypothetical protein
MIPQTFSEWLHCIKVECGIAVTRQFAQERLAIYKNTTHKETRKFAALYGEQHLNNIIQWLQQI